MSIAVVAEVDLSGLCTVRSAFTADYGAGYGNRTGVRDCAEAASISPAGYSRLWQETSLKELPDP
jgi:hypothetical protein